MSVQVARLIGGAGTGKTTELLTIMKSILGRIGDDPSAIGFASFTRAAREEMVARASEAFGCNPSLLERHGWFRTVHSTCHRMLGIKSDQLLAGDDKASKWIAEQLRVRVSWTKAGDSGYTTCVGDEEAAASLTLWDVSRNRIEPLTAVHAEKSHAGLEVPPIATVKHFVRKYEDAKRLDGKQDFVDILGRYAGVHFGLEGPEERDPEGDLPVGVRAWIFDEAQDSSALVDRVCRRLAYAPGVQWAYLAGDPFQCQPAGTPVLTSKGYKAIETLDPEKDWLIAFNRKDGKFYGTGGGVRFQKAWRDVDSGDLIEVTFADGTKSICTSNHKWMVRTIAKKAHATYIMRKGDRWRIGTVQMFATHSDRQRQKSGDFRLKMRMNGEAADAAWVLKVFGTDREARLYEQIASFKYGIPQVTFRPPCGCKNNLDAEFIEGVFCGLGDLTANAERCLSAHGLELSFPLTAKGDGAKNGSAAGRFLQAPNLLPGIHVVPKLLDGFFERRKRNSGNPRGVRSLAKEVEWVGVTSVRRLSAGLTVRVYSLEVERHHTYVTENGIVTGNCVYGFGGAEFGNFLSWEVDKERTMPQSWRCPKAVMELGERCLRRMRKGYFDRGIAPASHSGTVTREPSIERALCQVDSTRTTLVLARCNFSLAKFSSILESRKIPHARINDKEDTKALVAFNAYWKLQHGRNIGGHEWKAAIELTPTKATGDAIFLRRGEKAAWKNGRRDGIDFIHADEIESVGGVTPQLMDLIKGGRWAALLDGGKKWYDAAKRHGPEAATKPNVRLSTIHGAKGMEAQDVILATETAARVERERELDPRVHDEECRLEYVGVTRAKERLIVCDSDEPYSMELPY